MQRLGSAVVRIGAAILVLAVAIGVPIALARLVGRPYPTGEQLGEIWRTGRVSDDSVVRVGAALFLALWAWFAVTALSETVRVVRWRVDGRAAPLEPTPRTPLGWMQRLVRVALISTTAIVTTAVAAAPRLRAAGEVPWQPSTRVVAAAEAAVAPGPAFVSSGRDTPYSVAVRLGGAEMRERIIELNRGRSTPTGATWTGGVFPAGMDVVLPAGFASDGAMSWTPYTVVDGDSVYAIAARLCDGDGRLVGDVAAQIIERNLGRTMPDGRVFTEPALILPGWVLDVPLAAPASAEPADAVEHVVRGGDSYWRIAEEHLAATAAPAAPADVAELMRRLRDLNAPLLGYSDPNMIHPGDVVRIPTGVPEVAPDVEPPVVPADPVAVDLPAPSPPAAPSMDVPADPAPAPTPSTSDAPASTGVPPAPSTAPAVPASLPEPASLPVATAPPPHPAPADGGPAVEWPRDASATPIALGVGASVLLAAGALGVLEARRRQQLRRAAIASRLEPPTPSDVHVETTLRSLDARDKALRLDVALRAAAPSIVAVGRHVVAVMLGDDGRLSVFLDRPTDAQPPAPWEASADARAWTIGGEVTVDDLAPSARRAGQPCPALVHLGRSADGDVLVDLEAIGVLCVDGPSTSSQAIVRAVAAALAASPLDETLRVVTVGLPHDTHLGNLHAESADSLADAVVAAADAAFDAETLGARRTFALRVTSPGGEPWEPLLVAAIDADEAVADLVSLARGGGAGVGAIVDRLVPGVEWTLRHGHDGWTLSPLDLLVTPAGISADDVRALHDLLDAADRPIEPSADISYPDVTAQAIEREWKLMVCVLGQVRVVDGDGSEVAFERGKALELVAWLSQHRERPTRAAARTALWDLDVRDATFANVVSDARRAMARLVPPASGEEWIERTLTEQLPLHPLVVSDAELLHDRVARARGADASDAIELLRCGLELVTDMPFAGTGYLWPDAEGITSNLTLLATSAAIELARLYLDQGDIDGVFWATGRGLKVLAGHEELIALRMRAHAQRGDLAGVRSEWEVYERALTSDPWSSGEPSPKLAAIRRELLAAG